LHRSRPEPRLSTFERCWLGGATGRVRSPWRSPRSVSPLCPTCRPLKRTALLAKPVNGINAPQRPDCVAGHVRLELRNVVAKYPYEKSRRFPGIQPNSGHRDYSRLSCGVAETVISAGADSGSRRVQPRCRSTRSLEHWRATSVASSTRYWTSRRSKPASSNSKMRQTPAAPPTQTGFWWCDHASTIISKPP
jgi:hypothetical protein